MRWLPGPCLCLARPRVTSGQVEAALKTSGCEMERWSLSLFDPASYEENYRGAHSIRGTLASCHSGVLLCRRDRQRIWRLRLCHKYGIEMTMGCIVKWQCLRCQWRGIWQ